MVSKRKSKAELVLLNKAFVTETDTTKRLELKLSLVWEKTLEIREAWDKYNDSDQQQAMDELESFFCDDKKGLEFHSDISRERYRGDWSAE
jgi:hypothetical protein